MVQNLSADKSLFSHSMLLYRPNCKNNFSNNSAALPSCSFLFPLHINAKYLDRMLDWALSKLKWLKQIFIFLFSCRLLKTATSSLPNDSWWRCFLLPTTAGSLTTQAAWWVWTSPLCALFRSWSRQRKKQSTSTEGWIQDAPSPRLAPLRHRKRGERLALTLLLLPPAGLWPSSPLQAASNTPAFSQSACSCVNRNSRSVFLLVCGYFYEPVSGIF